MSCGWRRAKTSPLGAPYTGLRFGRAVDLHRRQRRRGIFDSRRFGGRGALFSPNAGKESICAARRARADAALSLGDGGARMGPSLARRIVAAGPDRGIYSPCQRRFLRDKQGAAMRSESPVVSVIVPVYNRAEQVVGAIDSIVEQTFENWELIAVDDGSTDETPAVLRACAEKDSRLRIIRQENKGVAAARNAALRAARGEIVSLQDSDDASLPSLLQNGVDFLRANPKIAGLHQRMKNSDSKGRPRGFAYLNKWQTLRISAMRSVGGYREFFVGSEDSDFNCRLEERGYRAVTSSHVLMSACRHQGARLSMGERKRRLFVDPARLRRATALGRDGFCRPRKDLFRDYGHFVFARAGRLRRFLARACALPHRSRRQKASAHRGVARAVWGRGKIHRQFARRIDSLRRYQFRRRRRRAPRPPFVADFFFAREKLRAVFE